MKKNVISALLLLFTTVLFGQNKFDRNKEYKSLEQAMKNPERIFKLNLSNQTIKLSDVDWSKFINLEYLNLKK